MEIDGTAAIVTGAASGLGAATARRLGAAGVKVTVVDLQDDLGAAVADEVGGTYVRADVTNGEHVAAAIVAAAELGPLRILVNCAGIATAARTLNRDGEAHDLRLFEKVVAVNLVGSFNCIRLAAAKMATTEPMASGERGAIVNTASVAAFDGQIGQAAYSASKGGVAGMTLPVARDLSAVGIRVNTIAPGLMDTPMLAGLPEEAIRSLGTQVLFPKRLGTPEEYAELAHFLITHSYMNAETVRLDGGIRMGPK
jgi:NAD(P)-dependent dehydrogenase (short-subunit alcohol dehydrogenase family)